MTTKRSLPFAPQPDSQQSEYDEGQGTGPKRYVVTAGRHAYLEENAKQLRKGDEPEQDRSDERGRLLHLSTLSQDWSGGRELNPRPTDY